MCRRLNSWETTCFLNNFLYDWINAGRVKNNIVIPTYKKDDKQEVENCRGIILLNACYMQYILEF